MKNIVVIGGGFAGISMARKLSEEKDIQVLSMRNKSNRLEELFMRLVESSTEGSR